MFKLEKSYLGFTNNKSPLQKSRIEGLLDKQIRSKQDGIIEIKQLIFNLILDGRVTEKEENYQYYKRDGELTKPKTVYRLIKDNIYMELNKTEYDFANYILDNQLNNIDNATKVIEKEKEIIRQQQEQEEIERQNKLNEEKAEEDFEIWLEDQAEQHPENDKYNIAKDVFMDEVGTFSNRQVELLVLIDNIDNPRCKEKLTDWLSYYNKASLKTFYHITGINLGKTDKEIQAKLKKLTSRDFQGIIKYKKKPVPEGHKKFYKLIGNNFEEAYGEYMRLKDFDLYITINSGLYNITEGKTGVIIAQGYSRDEAIERFNNNTDEHNIDMINTRIQEFISKNGLSPLYQDKIA